MTLSPSLNAPRDSGAHFLHFEQKSCNPKSIGRSQSMVDSYYNRSLEPRPHKRIDNARHPADYQARPQKNGGTQPDNSVRGEQKRIRLNVIGQNAMNPKQNTQRSQELLIQSLWR
jgi:hypothetical protein